MWAAFNVDSPTSAIDREIYPSSSIKFQQILAQKAYPLAEAIGSSNRPMRLMKWSLPSSLNLTWRASLLSPTLDRFFNNPLPCVEFGLRAEIPKSEARSIDPVDLRSPRASHHEIQCPSGFGSGLLTQVSPEHPWALPSKPLQRQRINTPRLTRGDKLHHKFAVIDNKTVITGSFNWSPAAAHTNDETLLMMYSPELAKHFTWEITK